VKLTPAAARIVANAQQEASRRKHGAVAAEHLLLALVDHSVAWRVKLPPPCRDDLRGFVEQELDRIPASNAYRDAATPALSKELVDALRPSRWTLFSRPLGPKDVMLKIAMLPRVRDWLSWASMDDLLVDDAIGEATSLATDRKHLTVKTLHFLRVIADQHWLAATPRLARTIDERLEAEAPGQTEPTLSEDLSVLVAKANVYARMARRPATSDMLLAIALREDEVAAVFEAAGVDVERLLSRIAHGDVELPLAPTSGMVGVFLHHDDFTPVELLKELLERKWQLGPNESKAALATAHDEGEAPIAKLPADEAIIRVDESRQRAREARLPLRLTIRRAT
jgi:ATP-dependent Clp protease adapter protein ClpS